MKLYALLLADVHGNVDKLSIVAVALDRGLLVRWEVSQRAENPYMEPAHEDAFGRSHEYQLTYKEGPLKWYNPPVAGIPSMGQIREIPHTYTDPERLRQRILDGGYYLVTEEMVRA